MRYDDPTANVDWGSLLNGIEPVLSEKRSNRTNFRKIQIINLYMKGDK